MTNQHMPAGFERCREDERHLTGRGQFVDDLRPPPGRPDPLFMAVVRSPYAHARIGAIATEQAAALPGVVAVHTGRALAEHLPPMTTVLAPGSKSVERRPLATDIARYAGDPVALVLAENSYAAADASLLVDVEYDPLPAVTDPEQALTPDAPVLYDELGANDVYRVSIGGGDITAAFAHASGTVTLRLVNQRVAASPLEPRACLFDFDPETGQLTAWISSQSIFRARDTLASSLGIPPRSIHVLNADVGGAFGTKSIFLGEEIAAAALAVRYGRPVKWIEDRSENLQAQVHGRGQINEVEAAYAADGRVLGMRVRTIADLGAFLLGPYPTFPIRTAKLVCGPYRIEAVAAEIIGVVTNKMPVGAYRGAGRPEATYIVERVMDRVAHVLQIDPVALRRRNLLTPDAFPYTTPPASSTIAATTRRRSSTPWPSRTTPAGASASASGATATRAICSASVCPRSLSQPVISRARKIRYRKQPPCVSCRMARCSCSAASPPRARATAPPSRRLPRRSFRSPARTSQYS